jgi:hypothetical protein
VDILKADKESTEEQWKTMFETPRYAKKEAEKTLRFLPEEQAADYPSVPHLYCLEINLSTMSKSAPR